MARDRALSRLLIIALQCCCLLTAARAKRGGNPADSSYESAHAAVQPENHHPVQQNQNPKPLDNVSLPGALAFLSFLDPVDAVGTALATPQSFMIQKTKSKGSGSSSSTSEFELGKDYWSHSHTKEKKRDDDDDEPEERGRVQLPRAGSVKLAENDERRTTVNRKSSGGSENTTGGTYGTYKDDNRLRENYERLRESSPVDVDARLEDIRARLGDDVLERLLERLGRVSLSPSSDGRSNGPRQLLPRGREGSRFTSKLSDEEKKLILAAVEMELLKAQKDQGGRFGRSRSGSDGSSSDGSVDLQSMASALAAAYAQGDSSSLVQLLTSDIGGTGGGSNKKIRSLMGMEQEYHPEMVAGGSTNNVDNGPSASNSLPQLSKTLQSYLMRAVKQAAAEQASAAGPAAAADSHSTTFLTARPIPNCPGGECLPVSIDPTNPVIIDFDSDDVSRRDRSARSPETPRNAARHASADPSYDYDGHHENSESLSRSGVAAAAAASGHTVHESFKDRCYDLVEFKSSTGEAIKANVPCGFAHLYHNDFAAADVTAHANRVHGTNTAGQEHSSAQGGSSGRRVEILHGMPEVRAREVLAAKREEAARRKASRTSPPMMMHRSENFGGADQFDELKMDPNIQSFLRGNSQLTEFLSTTSTEDLDRLLKSATSEEISAFLEGSVAGNSIEEEAVFGDSGMSRFANLPPPYDEYGTSDHLSDSYHQQVDAHAHDGSAHQSIRDDTAEAIFVDGDEWTCDVDVAPVRRELPCGTASTLDERIDNFISNLSLRERLRLRSRLNEIKCLTTGDGCDRDGILHRDHQRDGMWGRERGERDGMWSRERGERDGMWNRERDGMWNRERDGMWNRERDGMWSRERDGMRARNYHSYPVDHHYAGYDDYSGTWGHERDGMWSRERRERDGMWGRERGERDGMWGRERGERDGMWGRERGERDGMWGRDRGERGGMWGRERGERDGIWGREGGSHSCSYSACGASSTSRMAERRARRKRAGGCAIGSVLHRSNSECSKVRSPVFECGQSKALRFTSACEPDLATDLCPPRFSLVESRCLLRFNPLTNCPFGTSMLGGRCVPPPPISPPPPPPHAGGDHSHSGGVQPPPVYDGPQSHPDQYYESDVVWPECPGGYFFYDGQCLPGQPAPRRSLLSRSVVATCPTGFVPFDEMSYYESSLYSGVSDESPKMCARIVEADLSCPDGFDMVERSSGRLHDTIAGGGVLRGAVGGGMICQRSTRHRTVAVNCPTGYSQESHAQGLQCVSRKRINALSRICDRGRLEGSRCVETLAEPPQISCPVGYSISEDPTVSSHGHYEDRFFCTSSRHRNLLEGRLSPHRKCRAGASAHEGVCVRHKFNEPRLSCSSGELDHVAEECVSRSTVRPKLLCEAPNGGGLTERCVETSVVEVKRHCNAAMEEVCVEVDDAHESGGRHGIVGKRRVCPGMCIERVAAISTSTGLPHLRRLNENEEEESIGFCPADAQTVPGTAGFNCEISLPAAVPQGCSGRGAGCSGDGSSRALCPTGFESVGSICVEEPKEPKAT